MNKKHHVAAGLTTSSLKNFGKLLDVKNGETTPFTVLAALLLSVAALATFIGHTVMKVMFRITPVIDRLLLFLSFLCFLGLISLGIYLMSYQDHHWIGSPDSYIVTGLLFIFLSIAFILKVFKYGFNKSFSEEESILIPLKKEGWSEGKIQTWGEPTFVLLIGLFYSPYNLFGGGFMVFCAISQWCHILFDNIVGVDSLNTRTDAQNLKIVDDEYNSIQ